MCIAILNQSKAKALTKKTLKNCWENNGDGAGFIFIKEGKLETFKEMKDFNNFNKKYQEARKSGSNIVLHFRISTHGKINETNCHPFKVNEELAFVHNGIISDVPYSKEFSDTFMFNEHILQTLPNEFLNSTGIIELLRTFIGDYNKLVFLNVEDKFTIVNEEAGHWFEDNWFSNSSYKQVNDWYDYGGTKMKKSSFGSSWSYNSGYQSSVGYKGSSLPSAKSEAPKKWCDCFQAMMTEDDMVYYNCGKNLECKSCETHAHTEDAEVIDQNVGCCDFCGKYDILHTSDIDPNYGTELICSECIEWFNEPNDTGKAI
jgi:hypothetical protein